MNQDLKKARTLLEEGGFTCVLYRDEKYYTSTSRGVRPLLNWLDSGEDFSGCSAADKVVGKATAFLYCLLGVKAVYAHVMSTGAAQVLRMNEIVTVIGKEVPGIINRRGDGPCPFEAAVGDISDPGKALAAIRSKLAQM